MAIPAIITTKSRKLKGSNKSPDTQLFLCVFTLGQNSIYELPESALTRLLYENPRAQFELWEGLEKDAKSFSPSKPIPVSPDWKYQGIKIEKGIVTELEKENFIEVYPGIVWSPKLAKGQSLPNLDESQVLHITNFSGEPVLIGGKKVTSQGVSHTPEKVPNPIARLYWKQTESGGILSVTPLQDGVMLQGESSLLKELNKYLGELHLLLEYLGLEGTRYLAQDFVQGIGQGQDLSNGVTDLSDTGLTALMERTAFNRAKVLKKQVTGASEESLQDRKRLNQIKQNLPISF